MLKILSIDISCSITSNTKWLRDSRHHKWFLSHWIKPSKGSMQSARTKCSYSPTTCPQGILQATATTKSMITAKWEKWTVVRVLMIPQICSSMLKQLIARIKISNNTYYPSRLRAQLCSLTRTTTFLPSPTQTKTTCITSSRPSNKMAYLLIIFRPHTISLIVNWWRLRPGKLPC